MANTLPGSYYINESIKNLSSGHKKKKQNSRSKSMCEWSLSIHNNTVSSSPQSVGVNSLGHNAHVPFARSYVVNHQYDNSSKSGETANDRNEKSDCITTTTTTSTPQQRHLTDYPRWKKAHYHEVRDDSDSNDSEIHSLPLKQQTINASTLQNAQRFLMQFVKAFVSAGAPSHRLDHCTHLLLRKWDISAQFGYFPGFLIISFENSYDTFPTRVQLVKMDTHLDIHRLIGIYEVFESIMTDELTVQEATDQLHHVTRAPRLYPNWMLIIAYAVASSTSMPLFFYGGLMDMAFGFGLGSIVALGSIYVSQRITRFTSIFDVLQCTLVGFLAATASSRLSATDACFYALSVGGVVNLLPGYTTLVSMLEIASGAVASGTLRLTTTLVYSLLLGFGLAIGASTHQLLFPRLALISSHASCEDTLPPWSHVLLAPCFAIANAVVLGAHRRKFAIMLLLALLSHGVHYVALLYFVNYPHLATVLAAFVVAVVANLYARLWPTVGFVDMITGLFFLVPGSVGVTSTLDTFGQALSNAAASSSPSNAAVSEMSIILNAGQQGILFAVHIMVITVSVSVGLVLAALVIYPLRKLLDCNGPSSPLVSSSTGMTFASSSSSSMASSRKMKYRRRDWIGEVTF